MHTIDAHVQTLTETATAATSLIAIATHQLTRYPEDVPVDLARGQQVALRLLERDTRLALRNPDRDQYHSYHPKASEWAILLAPRSSAIRFYLSRATKRQFYQAQAACAAPRVQPGTLLAYWATSSHGFTQITTPEQTYRVLFASTADSLTHIPLDAPATGLAIPHERIDAQTTALCQTEAPSAATQR